MVSMTGVASATRTVSYQELEAARYPETYLRTEALTVLEDAVGGHEGPALIKLAKRHKARIRITVKAEIFDCNDVDEVM